MCLLKLKFIHVLLITSSILSFFVPQANGQPSIQARIDEAKEGDTVLLEDGIYFESFTVNKKIKVKAINAGSVTISGQTSRSFTWGSVKMKSFPCNSQKDSILVTLYRAVVPWRVKWVMRQENSLIEFNSVRDLIDLRFVSKNDTYCGKQDGGIEGFSWSGDTLSIRLVDPNLEKMNNLKISRDLTDEKQLIKIEANGVVIQDLRFECWPSRAIILNADDFALENSSFSGCNTAIYGHKSFDNGLSVKNCEFNMKPVYEYRLLEGINKKWWRALYNSNLHSFFINIQSGNNIEVINNYIHDSYDCMEIKGGSTEIAPNDTSIVAHNVIRGIVDNAFEFDVSWRETKIRAHHNFVMDCFTPISIAPFQSENGFAIFDHNIFYNSKSLGHPHPALIKNCYFNPKKQLPIPQRNIAIVHNTVVFYSETDNNMQVNRTNLWVKGCSIDKGKYEKSIVDNNIFYLKNDNGNWPFGDGYLFTSKNFLKTELTTLFEDKEIANSYEVLEINNPERKFYLKEQSIAVGNGSVDKYRYFQSNESNTVSIGAIEFGDEWDMPRPGPFWVKKLDLGRSKIPVEIDSFWLGF